MSGIVEILKKAEDDIRTIMLHKDNRYLRNLMEAAYLPSKKLNLPEGVPPYKPNSMEEAQVSPGVFWQVANKLSIYQQEHPKSVVMKVETSFIQALETLSKSEALTLLAVKDQTLHKMYKGLTYEALQKVGYFQ